ncbi:class I SAM-dependent methyltransferase [Candidatus Nitrosopumilus sediminis]|uniref:Methyltransferase type 11 domain-containing protein n=1 Tax=Candidatus Nitrosopumilus sediminis TaxID=1229909 RepID=K0BA92_9ARCH|nr:methyltransferase domain-containing protein [Candidatus Nitrosopumilus sediminis]AFS81875.1 hypothetical protein NSED_00315 [Candidatus Nitrosopumilus sediminis]
MNWLGEIIQNHVNSSDIVLDLGCGIMQATTDSIEKHPELSTLERLKGKKSIPANLNCKMIVGVDIWEKYLEKNKERYIVLKSNVENTEIFLDNSFDIVISLDVLEHMNEETSLKLLDEMERISRRKVIIYTPKQFELNEKNEEDAWGMGKNPYQLHKSLIKPEIFEKRGYNVTFPEPDKNTLAIKEIS